MSPDWTLPLGSRGLQTEPPSVAESSIAMPWWLSTALTILLALSACNTPALLNEKEWISQLEELTFHL